MAVLYTTGWEAGNLESYMYSNAGWVFLSGSASLITDTASQHRTQNGVGGSYSLFPNRGGTCLPGTLPASDSRWINFWAKQDPAFPWVYGLPNLIIAFSREETRQTSLLFNGLGGLSIKKGDGSIESQSNVFNPSLSHWFSIEVICAVSGTIRVYIDGELAYENTSINTQAHPTLTGWDAFALGDWWQDWSSYTYYFIDDIIVTDNTTGRVEEHYIVAIKPNGSGDQTDLTPTGSVNNYENVDDLPFNDLDYNAATSTGDTDLYNFEAPPTATSILCAKFSARVTSDGSLGHAEIAVKSGSTTAYGSTETLPASPSYNTIEHILEQDPNTSSAWDNTSISTVQAGIKFTT
jgi:hypothetical protein